MVWVSEGAGKERKALQTKTTHSSDPVVENWIQARSPSWNILPYLGSMLPLWWLQDDRICILYYGEATEDQDRCEVLTQILPTLKERAQIEQPETSLIIDASDRSISQKARQVRKTHQRRTIPPTRVHLLQKNVRVITLQKTHLQISSHSGRDRRRSKTQHALKVQLQRLQ